MVQTPVGPTTRGADGQPMFEVQRGRGRVLVARVHKLASVEDAETYVAAFARVRALSVKAPVLCADHRPVAIYPQPVAARLIALFTDLNVVWERAALVIAPTNAVLGMQLQRVVRDSGSPTRQLFDNPAAATTFLGEVCTPDEIASVTEFLSGYSPPR